MSPSSIDDHGTRPSKHRRRGTQTPEINYVDIMMDRRDKMKQSCNTSFRSIMQRSSLNDGPTAAHIQAQHVASFQAHNKHIVDFMYPSLQLTGEVVAFGSDDSDQLGLTTDPEKYKEDEYPPTLVPKSNLPTSNIKMIECGGTSSFALDYDGTLYSWGSNDEGQLGRGELQEGENYKIGEVPIRNVIQIAAGNTHTVFLNVDGQVYTTGQYYTQDYGKWRDGNSLQDFQRGEGEERDFVPHKLPRQLCNFDERVIRVAAGNNFSVALLEDGETLVSWGLGFDGQLGRSRSMYVVRATSLVLSFKLYCMIVSHIVQFLAPPLIGEPLSPTI
jgi:alpha-tubulin suppressor-like RCC1 family protein